MLGFIEWKYKKFYRCSFLNMNHKFINDTVWLIICFLKNLSLHNWFTNFYLIILGKFDLWIFDWITFLIAFSPIESSINCSLFYDIQFIMKSFIWYSREFWWIEQLLMYSLQRFTVNKEVMLSLFFGTGLEN